jgi:hypothetical protein
VDAGLVRSDGTLASMKRSGVLALSLLAVTPALHAEDGKVEIGLFAGASLLDVRTESTAQAALLIFPGGPPDLGFEFKTTTTLGNSFLLGFRGGYALSDRLAIEASFAAAPSARERSEFSISCNLSPCPFLPPAGSGGLVRRPTEDTVPTYHYDAGIRASFGGKLVVPFVTGGLGGVTYDAPDRARTNFAFNFGAGVLIGSGRFAARIEASDHVVVDHYLTGSAEHDVQLRGGISFRP